MRDTLLDRLQRTAAVCCIAMAIGALVITRDWWPALSVIAGGVLIGVSFLSIRGGIESLTASALGPRDPAPRSKTGRLIAKMVARYALLVLLAYVMIARLRLHPLGLLAGASSVVAAAALEARRLLKK